MTDAYNFGIKHRQASCGFLCAAITNILVKISILNLDLNITDATSNVFISSIYLIMNYYIVEIFFTVGTYRFEICNKFASLFL